MRLSETRASHSHKMWTEVSSSTSHPYMLLPLLLLDLTSGQFEVFMYIFYPIYYFLQLDNIFILL
jgi:hypothetical protein